MEGSEHTPSTSSSAPHDRFRAVTDHHDQAVVVHVTGEIDHATADLLREHAITAALWRSPPRVVLDLHQVTFCDSSGLHALIVIWRSVRTHHGDLIVAQPSQQCRTILERTGIDQRITVTSTLPDALARLADQQH